MFTYTAYESNTIYCFNLEPQCAANLAMSAISRLQWPASEETLLAAMSSRTDINSQFFGFTSSAIAESHYKKADEQLKHRGDLKEAYKIAEEVFLGRVALQEQRNAANRTESFITKYPQFVMQSYVWVYPEGIDDPAIDAEDYMQDNLLKIHEVISRTTDGCLNGIVYISLSNRCRNLKRNLNKALNTISCPPEVIDQTMQASQEEMPVEKAIETTEEKKLLESMLRSATPHEQRAILLRYAFEMSNKEIAAYLGVKPNYVKQMIFRGLKHMRKSEPGLLYESTYLSEQTSQI